MSIKEKMSFLNISAAHHYMFSQKTIPNSKFSQIVGQFNQSCLSII